MRVGVVAYYTRDRFGTMGPNEWGDALAGAAAPLALLWLVAGYSLQREELQSQREELRLQREELRLRVEETGRLVQHSGQQAETSANLLRLEELREAREARPEFVAQGGSSGGREIETTILNWGGHARNTTLHYDGPHELRLDVPEIFESKAQGRLRLREREPIEWPVQFTVECVDRLGIKHWMEFALDAAHKLREVHRRTDP